MAKIEMAADAPGLSRVKSRIARKAMKGAIAARRAAARVAS